MHPLQRHPQRWLPYQREKLPAELASALALNSHNVEAEAARDNRAREDEVELHAAAEGTVNSGAHVDMEAADSRDMRMERARMADRARPCSYPSEDGPGQM